MRRRLAVLWTTFMVLALAVYAAPVATAAGSTSNQFLWVATTTQTLVYDRTTTPPTLVATTDDAPTGSFARGTVVGSDVVYAATEHGIDTFDPQTGQFLSGFGANPSGYAQLTALPDGSKVYALRTDRSVVDVFAGNANLLDSIQLPGPATYMSDARPPNGDVILLGGVLDRATQTYGSATINTADNSLTSLSSGTTHVANGTVWKHDGSVAYVTTATQGSATGAIGRFTPPNVMTFAPTTGYTPRQIVISPNGQQLFVPATNATGVGGGVRVLDADTLAPLASLRYNTNASLGIPAMAPNGMLYLASGPDAVLANVAIFDTSRGGILDPLTFDNTEVLGVFVSAKAAAVRATSGANQKMYVGRVFDNPAVATVVDAAGNPMPNQLVSWTVTPAGAARLQGCFLCYARTGIDGTVSSPFIVAGSTPGNVTVVATPVEAAPGATSATFPLTILPAAVPPTVTALAAGDGQVGVTFTPGDGRGISPPTSFRVDATDVFHPEGGGQTATGTSSPITVTGLTNGDTYTFTVTAITPEGDWTSAPSQRITAGIPASITGTPPSGEVGKPYHFTFTVAGVPPPTVTLNSGTPLPDGLTFDPVTATISGTPAADAVGPAFVLITATNAVGSAQVTPTIIINPAGPATELEQTPATTPTTTPTTTPATSPSPSSGPAPPAASGGDYAAFTSQPLASTGMPADRFVGAAMVLIGLGSTLLLLLGRRRTSR